MDGKVIKVGTSLGFIIPRFIAVEGGFSCGIPINIEYNNDRIIITKKTDLRSGWSEAFARYAKEGEEEPLIPDFIDTEVDKIL